MKIKFTSQLFAIFIVVLFTGRVFAQVEIIIDGGTKSGIPLAVVPFKTPDGIELEHEIHKIVANNLYTTGKFEPIPSEKYLTFPAKLEDVRAKDWRLINAQVLVFGEIWALGRNSYEVIYRMYDVARDVQIGQTKRVAKVRGEDMRAVAHLISDDVYKAVTNRGGAFQSKLAYVEREQLSPQKFRYKLMVSDWDGFNPVKVYRSKNPILSPSWSPDSRKIAFVNLSKNGPIVRVVDLNNGRVETIADFKGVNSAPAWSPDGSKIAYSSSRHGSPDVFVYDIEAKEHIRITKHYGIDTEPSWGPRSETLLFTSNRSRKPQIFRYSLLDESIERMTFEGDENANASYDEAGKNVVMVHDGGNIVLLNPETSEMQWLTKAKFDESPSFSPNGDMVLYMTEQGFEPAMIVASVDGRVRTKVEFVRGDVREPAWSPLKK